MATDAGKDDALRSAAAGFVDGFRAFLQGRLAEDPALRPFAEALEPIDTDLLARAAVRRRDHGAMRYLDDLCAEASEHPECMTGNDAARQMNFMPVFDGDNIDPALANGMLAAQAVGTYGCFDSSTLAVGLFLIAPGVSYPLHTHAAAEIYWALGGEITLCHGIEGTPFTLRQGDYSVTPPHRLHSLSTGEEPVLLAYLWTGDLFDPIWWWDEERPGAWRRTEWRRPPGESFQAIRAEDVTPELKAQAHP